MLADPFRVKTVPGQDLHWKRPVLIFDVAHLVDHHLDLEPVLVEDGPADQVLVRQRLGAEVETRDVPGVGEPSWDVFAGSPSFEKRLKNVRNNEVRP